MTDLPSPMRVFQSGLNGPAPVMGPSLSGQDDLDGLIKQQLHIAYDSMSTEDFAPTMVMRQGNPDLIDDVGDYLIRTAALWAQLTENIVAGDHMTQAVRARNRRSEQLSGMADMTFLAELDRKLKKLREVRNVSARYFQDVQRILGTQSPQSGVSENSRTSDSGLQDGLQSSADTGTQSSIDGNSRRRARRTLPAARQNDPTSPNGQESDNDDSDDDEELFQSLDMDSLRSRGKGSYHCPKGVDCTKGGVDKDGNLVAFERNSSFVQHCNKHRKPFRCTQDYCPNLPKKRRFARRDGLERHLRSVSHQPPNQHIATDSYAPMDMA